MPEIALVVTDSYPDTPDRDTAPVLRELAVLGASAQAVVWHDPSVDWHRFDLIVMRSPWDYPHRLIDFLTWMDALPQERVANPPGLVRWGLDKAYLLELAARGIPVTPTALCTTVTEVLAAARATGSELVVVKPAVSVAARGAQLLQVNSLRAEKGRATAGISAALRQYGRLLVQPAIPEIAEHGEHDLLMIEGQLVHTVHKGPVLAPGGGYLGGQYTERLSPGAVRPEEEALASEVCQAIGALADERGWTAGQQMPLQARIDLVTTAEGPQLIEAELFEPQYFCRLARGSERLVAAGIARRAGLEVRPSRL